MTIVDHKVKKDIVLLRIYFSQNKNSYLLIFSKLLLEVTFYIISQRHCLLATSFFCILKTTSVPLLVTKTVCWIISFVCKTATIERTSCKEKRSYKNSYKKSEQLRPQSDIRSTFPWIKYKTHCWVGSITLHYFKNTQINNERWKRPENKV